MAVATEREPKEELIKGLGLLDATTLVVGSMIGSGIFIAPSLMAGYIQTPGIIILLWIIGGVLTICGALSYGELSSSMPKAGGQYVFLRETYSPLWGFLYGWTVFWVIQTGFVAAVAVAFAKYLGVFFPAISEKAILFQISFPLHLTFSTAQAVGIVSIVILTLINCLGVRAGAFVQNLFTILKTGAIVALILFAFTSIKGSSSHFSPLLSPISLGSAGLKMGLFAALAVAMSKALFAYDAWNTVTFTAGEIKNPQRNLPLSLFLGTLAVTAIYTLATMAYMYMVPIHEMANVADNRIAAETALRIFGNVGLYLISGAILISTFGCNNGLILGGPRVYYAMAKDGLFFKGAAKVHEKFHTPIHSLVYQGIWASLLTLTGTYNDLLTYTAFASLLFNAMTVAGVYVLRKKSPDLERPYKVPGYPWVPALYIAIALFFLFYIVQGDPRNSGLGLLLVLTGVPVYFLWRRKT